MAVRGGVEVVVIPAGEPDPLEPLRELPELRRETPAVQVTIRRPAAPANDPPNK